MTTPSQDRIHRSIGAIVGLAVGDALGAPFEFRPAGTYRRRFPEPVLGSIGEMIGGGGWEPGEFTACCSGVETDDRARHAMARVLITGCSTGIGRATAVELSARGHEVVATARRPESLDGLEVAERLALDVDDTASVQGAVTAAGTVDVLVNNAGWESAGPVEKADLDEVRAMFETNLLGAARMVQAVLPAMRERGSGTIVNVSSVAGVVAGPLNGFYAASKHALEAMSESLHYEVGHFGVRVVIIEPGAFATAFGDNARRHGEDTAPYEELRKQWDAASEVLAGGTAPGPEAVAVAIADAIEADASPLRIPVGDDAQLVVAVRAAHDDAAFEATMRETLGLTW